MRSAVQRFLLCLLFAAGISAFAGEKFNPKQAIARYDAIYVQRLNINGTSKDEKGAEELLLESEVTTNFIELLRKRGFTVIDSPDPKRGNVLVVRTAAKFEAGNRAVRFTILGSFGGGKASLIVSMDAIDGLAQKLIATKTTTEESRNAFRSQGSIVLASVDDAWSELLEAVNESTPESVASSPSVTEKEPEKTVATPASEKSAPNRLRELEKLYKEGLLTQAEYEGKRKAILEAL